MHNDVGIKFGGSDPRKDGAAIPEPAHVFATSAKAGARNWPKEASPGFSRRCRSRLAKLPGCSGTSACFRTCLNWLQVYPG